MAGLPADAAIWRDHELTRSEELAAIGLERSDAWAKALWEVALRPYLKKPPKDISNPGVIEVPRPGEQRRARADPDGQKPEMTPKQMSRKRASLFT